MFVVRRAESSYQDAPHFPMCSTRHAATRCPGQVRTGVTFAEAAAEWLSYIEHDRERKPSTVAGYKALVRSQLLPAFGEQPIESK